MFPLLYRVIGSLVMEWAHHAQKDLVWAYCISFWGPQMKWVTVSFGKIQRNNKINKRFMDKDRV